MHPLNERTERHASELQTIDPAVADAFREAARAIGERLDGDGLRDWAESAADLAHRAPQAAAAFVRATPQALARLERRDLTTWARQGRRLCRGGWTSARLAAEFFRLGPDLLDAVPVPALERLVDVVASVALRSNEVASICLRDAAVALAQLAENDREIFLSLTQAVGAVSWPDTHRCLERGPGLLAAIAPGPRRGLVALATAACREVRTEGFELFAASAEALGGLDPVQQAEAVGLAERLAPHGVRAAMHSMMSAPEVRRRLSSPAAMRWAEAGLELAARASSPETAESYFLIESALAEEMLNDLAGGVHLREVAGVLRLYARALSGEPLPVQPTGALVARRIGWLEEATPSTDGVAIYLPPTVDSLGDKQSNFQVYKVYTTHQVGRIEFGSFRYRFDVDGRYLRSTSGDRERRRAEAGARQSSAVTPIQHFHDLFDDRRLGLELFTLVEDARIDARVTREYPGILRWLRRVQEREVERRPDAGRMPARQAFVEHLLRISLGHRDVSLWPRALADRLQRAADTLEVVSRDGATVQDAAEVTSALYDLAIEVPNRPPGAGSPGGAEVPYRGLDGAAYRGAFKPELVQLLDAIGDGRGIEEDRGVPLTREQILELLANSAEIELDEDAPDGRSDLDALRFRIEHEAGESPDEPASDAVEAEPDPAISWFRYDEWDFRAGDYRPGWCRVGERVGAEGELDFYSETLRRHHGLVIETRRQFERMRPESFRRLKRLEDGHEIDLDQAIEFHADRKAGAGPLARFYSRRNKIKRDVAVAFLLDMSGSTGEKIVAPPSSTSGTDKRIIDVERESAVLVVEALEAIGDTYGIYAFSGHGRENVEFHVIKDLDEDFDDAVRRRIDGIEPVRSTRMGPAIRHTTAKLADHEARVKILILVSDGRPQDDDYGRDPSERDYALHDTRCALVEAKRQRIAVFLITVDTAGQDYLRQMCDDMSYEIVSDIESLPRRLPKLYQHLAGE